MKGFERNKTMINRLKRATTISLLGLLTTAPIFAQQTETPKIDREQRVQKRIEIMKQRLAITDDQAAKLSDVLKTEHQTLAADRQKMQNAPADQKPYARLQMKQDMLAGKQKMLDVLTPEQRVKAEQFHKERMSKMKHKWMRHHRK
jgi:Spy/CpxP family protein refolding chaperone